MSDFENIFKLLVGDQNLAYNFNIFVKVISKVIMKLRIILSLDQVIYAFPAFLQFKALQKQL